MYIVTTVSFSHFVLPSRVFKTLLRSISFVFICSVAWLLIESIRSKLTMGDFTFGSTWPSMKTSIRQLTSFVYDGINSYIQYIVHQRQYMAVYDNGDSAIDILPLLHDDINVFVDVSENSCRFRCLIQLMNVIK